MTTDVVLLIALGERPNDRAAVPAGVEKAIQLARGVSRHQDWLATDKAREKVVSLRDLALQANKDPRTFENAQHLHFINGRVTKHLSTHAEDLLGRSSMRRRASTTGWVTILS